jgi:hypothetical protein
MSVVDAPVRPRSIAEAVERLTAPGSRFGSKRPTSAACRRRSGNTAPLRSKILEPEVETVLEA